MERFQDFVKVVATMSREEFLEHFPHPILFSFEQPSARECDHTQLLDYQDACRKIDLFSSRVLDFVPLLPSPHTNREFPKKALIGRDDDRDFVIQHDSVSKRHGYLLYDEERACYSLVDSGSTNGTQVDGQPLEPGTPFSLKDGDLITLGRLVFLFFSPMGAYSYMQQYREQQEKRKPH